MKTYLIKMLNWKILKVDKINNQLVIELNEAIQHRDQLTEQIKSKREMRMSYVNENEST